MFKTGEGLGMRAVCILPYPHEDTEVVLKEIKEIIVKFIWQFDIEAEVLMDPGGYEIIVASYSDQPDWFFDSISLSLFDAIYERGYRLLDHETRQPYWLKTKGDLRCQLLLMSKGIANLESQKKNLKNLIQQLT